MKAFEETDFAGRIQDFAEKISESASSHQLTALMWQFNRLLGLSGSVFASFAREDETRESYRFITACPPAWCQEYNANAWYTIDPCLLYALTHTAPALISDIPLRSRGQRNMIEAAKLQGFESGLVIPAHSPAGRSRMGVLYLGSSDPQYLDPLALKHLRFWLRAIASELLDWWTRRVRADLLAGGELSCDEREMLLMTVQGSTSKEIALRLGTTHNAVDQRMHRLIARFGATSRRDAANLADQYGMLS